MKTEFRSAVRLLKMLKLVFISCIVFYPSIILAAKQSRYLKASMSTTSWKFKDLLGYNNSSPVKVYPNQALSPGDQYGHAISIWEDFALISSTGRALSDSSGSSVDAGLVFQFRLQVGGWRQVNNVLTSGATSDAYGESLALRDGFAVVGAWKDSSFGTFSGKAYIYKTRNTGDGQSLVLAQVITANNAAAGDFFGFSVALVPQFDAYMKGAAIVGAFGHNRDNNVVDNGAVFVFAKISDSWLQVAMLQASDGQSFDSFGWSVAAVDNVIVVGAPEAGSSLSQGGAVYVYVFESEQFQYRRQLQEPSPEQRQGQQQQQPNEPFQDSTTFVRWNYLELMKFTSGSGGAANSMFGVDVAVHNDSTALTVAVGACLDSSRAYHAGAVYVYSRLRTADLLKKFVYGDNRNQNQKDQQQQQKDKDQQQQQKEQQKRGLRSGQAEGKESSFQGSEPSRSGSEQRSSGSRRLQQQQQQQQPAQGHYEVVATGLFADRQGRHWVTEASLLGSTELMRLGRSLALRDGALVVGADMSGLAPGKAFVFARQQSSLLVSSASIVSGPLRNTTWVKAANLKNPSAAVGDFFGASCDIYGDRAMVGAYMNNAADSKLRSSSRSGDDSSGYYPGFAYSYFANDASYLDASAFANSSLFTTSTFMATLALTLALLVVFATGMLVYRGIKAQANKQGYHHTNTLDISSNTVSKTDNTSSAIDVSLRSNDPLQPSRGGSSGVHLSSFRKKRNKVASMSAHGIPTGSFPPDCGHSSGGAGPDGLGGEHYHSPNLLEEHGLGLPTASVSAARSVVNTPYAGSATKTFNVVSNQQQSAHGRANPLQMTNPLMRPLPGAVNVAGAGGDSRRKSSLTRKTAGAIDFNAPSDF